jgi:hypothetical protein
MHGGSCRGLCGINVSPHFPDKEWFRAIWGESSVDRQNGTVWWPIKATHFDTVTDAITMRR